MIYILFYYSPNISEGGRHGERDKGQADHGAEENGRGQQWDSTQWIWEKGMLFTNRISPPVLDVPYIYFYFTIYNCRL